MSNKQDKTTPSVEEIPSRHWADQAADELIQRQAKKPDNTAEIVCASGISPSGMVHIGNFREVITVDFVVRALRDRGQKVRFIYSWDDFDAFRKVPANLPNPEKLNTELRKPISDVVDPFGTHASYAKHFESLFEAEISQLGIAPQFIYQNEAYRACRYVQGIQTALTYEKTIARILNEHRTEPLPDNWSLLSVFCSQCNKDTTRLVSHTPPTLLRYYCATCKVELETDFSNQGNVKLLWRVDWPMRWAHEGVDFEPGGKDHSSTGGSYETGAKIVREVWKKEPPYYVQYDFVMAKGLGVKLSSSSGQLITLTQALQVYEPSVIRWIFASRKPNLDFTIAFDLDVLKAYDDFDRCEKYAYGHLDGDPKKTSYEMRIYQLSCVTPGLLLEKSKMPKQFPFRHLCNVLQIHQGNVEQAEKVYEIESEADRIRFRSRASRAWAWIQNFAPEDFQFRLRELKGPTHTSNYMGSLRALIGLLESDGFSAWTEDELANRVFGIMKADGIEPKLFFQDVYQCLIGKNQGPKLASFLKAIGKETAIKLFKKALSEPQ